MTYTHGHHESVLRSHTWRTAQNSAAYLLPHLRSGQSLLDVGCGPGTITSDLALLVAPGDVVGIDASADVVAQAAAQAAGLGLANLRFEVGRPLRPGVRRCLVRRDPPAPGAPASRRPRGCAGGAAARAGARRCPGGPGLGLPRLHLGARRPDARPLDGPVLRGDRAQRPRRPHRAEADGPRPGQRASTRSKSRARPGPTPTLRRGHGGAACGPTGSATHASASRRSSTG